MLVECDLVTAWSACTECEQRLTHVMGRWILIRHHTDTDYAPVETRACNMCLPTPPRVSSTLERSRTRTGPVLRRAPGRSSVSAHPLGGLDGRDWVARASSPRVRRAVAASPRRPRVYLSLHSCCGAFNLRKRFVSAAGQDRPL